MIEQNCDSGESSSKGRLWCRKSERLMTGTKKRRMMFQGTWGGERIEPSRRFMYINFFKKCRKQKGFLRIGRMESLFLYTRKGVKEKMKFIKVITLFNSAYKIYAILLTERLREEVESKGILLETQVRFRSESVIPDNMYVFQHVKDKKLAEESKVEKRI